MIFFTLDEAETEDKCELSNDRKQKRNTNKKVRNGFNLI